MFYNYFAINLNFNQIHIVFHCVYCGEKIPGLSQRNNQQQRNIFSSNILSPLMR